MTCATAEGACDGRHSRMLLTGRDVNRGQTLEAEVEAEAKFNRPSPRPKLKKPNRTLYFAMKIYAIETLCDSIDIFQPNK